MSNYSLRELPFELYDKLWRIPAAVERFETRVSELSQAILDCRALMRRQEALASRVDPTFVYVLPVATPMMVQMARVERMKRMTVPFMAHHPIDAGTWVVVAGPATVRAVMLGNMLQTAISDPQGQVCKVAEQWLPGVILRVELEAP